MKIAPVLSLLKSNNILLNRINIKQNNLKFGTSIDTFEKSEENSAFRKFLAEMDSEDLAEEITKNILTSKSGEFLEQTAIDFASAIQMYKFNISVNNIELTPEKNRDLIEAVYTIFSVLKNGDTLNRDMVFANESVNAVLYYVLNGQKFYLDAMKSSKGKDGIDIDMYNALIEYYQMTGGKKSISELKSNIMTHCLDKEGKVSKDKFPAIPKLMLELWSDDYAIVSKVKKQILDKEGNIDKRKYDFVYKTLASLNKTIEEEFSSFEIAGNLEEFFSIKINILNAIINGAKTEDSYDPIRAYKSFEGWLRYAKENKTQANNGIAFVKMNNITKKQQKVPLTSMLGAIEENSTRGKYLNSAIYRLQEVLYGESLFDGWKN